MNLDQVFKGCLITLALLIVALALGIYGMTRPATWKDMARKTGIRVPAGAVLSPVQHPTEVEYLGTIDLQSAADVQDFIHLNGLTPMSEHVEANGWVNRGRLAYDVPKERYADTYVLWAHSKFDTWEFILDPTTRRVQYEVLVPDYAGDLPFDDSEAHATPADAERGKDARR